MKAKYTFNKKADNSAKAIGIDLPISFKQSIEICNYIRGDSLKVAKIKLEGAISKKKPIPFKRFTNGLGHKKGNLTTGRYPIKASTNILKLVESAEKNAVFKGLSIERLEVLHISAKQSPANFRYGRHSRRKAKKCHVEIVLSESEKDIPTKSSDNKKTLQNKQDTKQEKQNLSEDTNDNVKNNVDNNANVEVKDDNNKETNNKETNNKETNNKETNNNKASPKNLSKESTKQSKPADKSTVKGSSTNDNSLGENKK